MYFQEPLSYRKDSTQKRPYNNYLRTKKFRTLKDYEKQRKEEINPIFKASSIGLDEKELDSWK